MSYFEMPTIANLLENSEILFHNKGTKLYHTMENDDEKFGILRMKINENTTMCPVVPDLPHPPLPQKIAMIFTIDTSASMSDFCSDNKRKIEHAIQTLCGIMKFLANEHEKSQKEIHVAVLAFSNKVRTIVEFTQIKKENLIEIVDRISRIQLVDSTNIEAALKKANEMLVKYVSDNHPDAVMYHIQLTDGEVTEGEEDHNKLAEMVNPNYNNIFVGFGKYHDDQLLCKLSENPRNEYRFIDKLEYSSIVYGEILYNILYHKYDYIDIVLKGAEIYDWRTNSWGEKLRVHNLSYDSERIFQLRTVLVDTTEIEANICDNNNEFTIIYSYPELVDIESGTKENRDLTKYSFRQRTQELLYEVREFIQKQQENIRKNSDASQYFTNMFRPDHESQQDLSIEIPDVEQDPKKIIYEKCQTFMRTIKEYVEENNLTDDRSLKLLQDDIYIVLKTLYRRNAHMWCTTRQISLGREHSYQPTQFADDAPEYDPEQTFTTMRRPKLRRNRVYTMPNSPISTFPLFDDDQDHNSDLPIWITGDIDDESTTRYELSQNFDMTMMSPTMARTVTEVIVPDENTIRET